MFKDYRYINAGTNEIYRYGKKARERVKAAMIANENGYISIQTDGGRYWTIGTSDGKYGEFCKINGTIFSVNKGGFAYAKAGTDKGEAFEKALEAMINEMIRLDDARVATEEDEDEE